MAGIVLVVVGIGVSLSFHNMIADLPILNGFLISRVHSLLIYERSKINYLTTCIISPLIIIKPLICVVVFKFFMLFLNINPAALLLYLTDDMVIP